MISKLIDGIVNKKAPVVAGLDPNLKFIPPHLLKEAADEKGETLEAAADAILRFNKAIVDAITTRYEAKERLSDIQNEILKHIKETGEDIWEKLDRYL